MIRKLTESREIKLDFTNRPKDISDEDYDKFLDITYNGIEIHPKYDDVPFAWDPTFYIEGNNIKIVGDFGQQGSHNGKVEITLPLDKVSKYYDIFVQPEDGYEDEVIELLKKYNLI